MTVENIPSDQNASIYYSVGTSSTELVLQPRCSRRQAMRAAWLGLVGFEVFLLPLTILPTFLVMVFILMTLSLTTPVFLNHWITKVFIFLLWAACLATIALLTGKAVRESGYTTFIFDCIQKHFAIHTVNLLGRKSVRKIAFEQIRDTKFQEYESDGVSIAICLLLEKRKILGFTQQEIITLSSFSSEEYKTVANLTALKHHKELLYLVRKTLGLSTHEIDEWLRDFRIPTEVELQQEKTQAILKAKDTVRTFGKVTKTIFSGEQAKQAELEVWRQKTRYLPEDPDVWEQFALLLALQKNVSRDEVVSAYRRAEALYRGRGDITNAMKITQTLKRMG